MVGLPNPANESDSRVVRDRDGHSPIIMLGRIILQFRMPSGQTETVENGGSSIAWEKQPTNNFQRMG
jgi:hypothetical protein